MKPVCAVCKWWHRHEVNKGTCQFDPPPVFWAAVDAITQEPAAQIDHRRVAEGPFETEGGDTCSCFQQET